MFIMLATVGPRGDRAPCGRGRFSFGSTQVSRNLGFSSWSEMIDHFRTDAGAR